MTLIPLAWFDQAAKRIAPFIKHTPLTYDAELNIYIKWENHQVTGSFKARGALNKVLGLEKWEQQRGFVTASAGNHGQGVALAANLVHAPIIVFSAAHAVPEKINAMQLLGAEVRLVQGGYGEAEAVGNAYARQIGATWISPYNDGLIIAGQGTIGVELLKDLSGIPTSVWIAPAGGGGLVSGIGGVLQYQEKRPRLIAVQSDASRFLHAIYHTGSQAGVIEQSSLADGLAGPVETDSVTIPLCQQMVDEFILANEEELAQAIAYAWHTYQQRIEGSAAVVLAAILSGKITRRPAVIIITGGNIQTEIHAQIISKY
jgi:threonine dehydratase